MVVLTDEKLAEYGIVTRASKGAELTHEEMDNNVVTALDVMMFDSVSWDGRDEYPAIVGAEVAPTAGNTVTLNPVNGYCAIKLKGSANVGNSVEWASGYNGWIYNQSFLNATSSNAGEVGVSISIQDGDEYLVILSPISIDVSFTGSATAGIVQDIPPMPDIPTFGEGA